MCILVVVLVLITDFESLENYSCCSSGSITEVAASCRKEFVTPFFPFIFKIYFKISA